MVKKKKKSTAAANVPLNLSKTLDDFHDMLNGIESQLFPLFSEQNTELQQGLRKVVSVEQSHLNTVLAYNLNALFWMFLRIQGVDAENHFAAAEMKRIREYFERIEKKSSKQAELLAGGAVRPSSLDKAAAVRFLKHQIPELRESNNQAPSSSLATNQETPPSSAQTVPPQQQPGQQLSKSQKKRLKRKLSQSKLLKTSSALSPKDQVKSDTGKKRKLSMNGGPPPRQFRAKKKKKKSQ